MITYLIHPDGSVDILQGTQVLCTLTATEAGELAWDLALAQGWRFVLSLIFTYLTGGR